MGVWLPLLLLVLSPRCSHGQRHTGDDVADMLTALRGRVSFDHVLMLTVSQNESACAYADMTSQRHRTYCHHVARIIPQGVKQKSVAFEMLKSFSQAGFSMKSIHITGNCVHSSIEGIPLSHLWVDEMLSHVIRRPSGVTPLVLVPQMDDCSESLLSEWWSSANSKNVEGKKWLWLLLYENNTKRHSLYSWDIPIDTQVMVARKAGDQVFLYEVYRLKGLRASREVPLGNWSSQGLSWTTVSFFNRRGDLSGTTVTAIVQNHPPFSTYNMQYAILGGLVGEVWHTLERQLNFSTVYVAALVPHVEESAVIEYRNMADVSLRDITLLPSVYPGSQFTAPLTFITLRIFVKEPGVRGLVWDSFLIPFTPRLWMMAGIIVIVASICVTLVLHFQFQSEPLHNTVTAAILTTVGVFCQQSPAMRYLTPSSRVLLLVLHLTAAVLLAGYSAAVISSLALKPAPLPFDNVQGLISDTTYHITTTLEDSEMIIGWLTNDRVLSQLFTSNGGSHLNSTPHDILEGVLQLCEHKYALLTRLEAILHIAGHIPCEVAALPGLSLKLNVVLPLSDRFAFVRLANHYINDMWRSGLLSRLPKQTWTYSFEQQVSYNSVSFMNVMPLLAFLAAGWFLAAIILFLERVVNSMCRAGTDRVL